MTFYEAHPLLTIILGVYSVVMLIFFGIVAEALIDAINRGGKS